MPGSTIEVEGRNVGRKDIALDPFGQILNLQLEVAGQAVLHPRDGVELPGIALLRHIQPVSLRVVGQAFEPLVAAGQNAERQRLGVSQMNRPRYCR
ncbi:hypothetical protein D9M71_703350 [compost metagenome]